MVGYTVNIENFEHIKMFIMMAMGGARIVFTLRVYLLTGVYVLGCIGVSTCLWAWVYWGYTALLIIMSRFGICL